MAKLLPTVWLEYFSVSSKSDYGDPKGTKNFLPLQHLHQKKLEVVVARMCALKLQYFHASQPSNNLFHCFEYSLGSVSPLVKLRHNSVVSIPEQCAGDMLLNLQLKIALACFLFLLYLFINSHLIWWPLSFFRFLQHYSSQGTYLSLSLIFAD